MTNNNNTNTNNTNETAANTSKGKKTNKDIKIYSVQASDIIKINRDNDTKTRDRLDYDTVLPYSLLLWKLKKLNKHHLKKSGKSIASSIDFIDVNFDFGYHTERCKDLMNQQKQLEADKKEINQDKGMDADVKKIQIGLLKDQIEELEKLIKAEKKPWNKNNLRTKLYTEGFDLTHTETKKGKTISKTIHYRYWFRTPSKVRVGDSVFINEKIYDDIIQWQNMHLTLPEGETKVVEFEAYKTLTASGIVDKIEINPKNILVINDLTSYMDTDLLSVQIDDDGECIVVPKHGKVHNVLYDGQMLLDSKYFKEGDHFYLLRQHMFKACAFKTNVIQFMHDYCDRNGLDFEIAQVKDRYGNNMRVKDIHGITTENACKFEKFAECGCTDRDGNLITSKKQMYSYWCKLVREYEKNIFGICKTDHKSKYGAMQRMSYQMCNTLLITPQQTQELVQPTIDYVNNLKLNDNAFLAHLHDTASKGNNNNLMIDLYKRNSNFRECDFYKIFKSDTISTLKKRVKSGKILTNGDNLTTCGSPYLMLLHAVGELPCHEVEGCWVLNDDVIDPTLPICDDCIACYTERFDDGEYLGAFRNPHNASNNIAYLRVYKSDLMEKYFDFGQNVCALGCVKNEAQPLTNGQDFDSDFMLCTNDPIVLFAAKKVFRHRDYTCIVNNIPEEKKPWINCVESIAEIDNLLAKGKDDIGQSSNLAQEALSHYQHTGCTNQRLRDIVCITSVLAQCAIDSAKREYKVDVGVVLQKLKSDPELKTKVPEINKKTGKVKIDKKTGEEKKVDRSLLPEWMQEIKAKKKKKEQTFRCNCTMQYLQNIVDDKNTGIINLKGGGRGNTNPEVETLLVDHIKFNDKTNYDQIEKIDELIGNYDRTVKYYNQCGGKLKWEKSKIEGKIAPLRDTVTSRIASLKITDETMFKLVSRAIADVKKETDKSDDEKSDLKKIRIKMLNTLYNSDKHRDQMLSMFQKCE